MAVGGGEWVVDGDEFAPDRSGDSQEISELQGEFLGSKLIACYNLDAGVGM